jgi:DNA polymerase-3 subunit epsilon
MKKYDLTELAALAVDCQATHSNPEVGHLVEIGWEAIRASNPFDRESITNQVQSHLVKLGESVQIPKQFSRMTGIKSEDMKEAISTKTIWQRLLHTAQEISARNQGICPAVIHFRRYEEPFLIKLHQEFSLDVDFPFTIVCTHEIMRRLYPGLPRKSLRAVAGYFGLSLPVLRRSQHHVVATAFIWDQVVRLLEEQEKITTFPELLNWLRDPPSLPLSKQCYREYPMEKALRQNLPDKPGIYRMYRSTGDLLYIGKAKSLKNRVNSYFHKRGRHAEHILEMLSQAKNLSTTVTETALEAAVRESDEIKLQAPPYNRALLPNERKLLFYARDFKSKRSDPNTQHPIGPIPSNTNMDSLAKFMDVLNGRTKKFTIRTIEAILEAPPGYSPEKECFKSGLEAFKKEYFAQMEKPVNLLHMMKWGTQFWEEKLIEKEQKRLEDSGDEIEEPEEEEEQKETEEVWTPGRVVKSLKRMVRMAAFHTRRARWFCRLSESTIRWAKASENKGLTNTVEIKKGIPLFKGPWNSSGKICEPVGHGKALLERQKCFDIDTFDRMRIVTSEMRRIIQEGRDLELCFHPGSILDKVHLDKMLKWV